MHYFSKYFWITFTLFTVNQLLEEAGIFIPWIHSYLDDLLAAGIVLGFTLTFQQQLTFRNNNYRFSAGHAIFFVIWYSLLFEVVLPHFDARHHADILDVVAYIAGSFLFMALGNKPAQKLIHTGKKEKKIN